ncbi:MAG TPA: methyltransferase domain-containing protein [Streptosporangiaceae bacterium]|nr:methyltransferase domain-containing protein [Streptosporangiaceae bacterium]
MSGYNDYDAFAAGYSADNENNATNAYYERPASLALLGDVAGQRVLDAGCGAGAHAAELLKRGARVTGLDKSGGLLAIARQRLGAAVPLHEGDLADPLPFPSASFEAVLASLVVHYLEGWGPFMDHPLGGGPSYFATYDFTEEWTKGGQTVLMRFWHRPLHAMTDAFQAAGFILDVMREPEPDPAAEALFPAVYADLRTNPRFLFFRLIAP